MTIREDKDVDQSSKRSCVANIAFRLFRYGLVCLCAEVIMRCIKNNFIDSNDSVEGSYRLSKMSGCGKPVENGSTVIVEEKPTRAQWTNKMEFLMSCVAFSVGLGNVWRFPYTAYQNGGGAFLVPYVIVLFIVGKPIYYMEMILGQFSSRSCIKIWSICPLFRGIGYGLTISVFSVVTYYCSLMALTLYYLSASFQSVLPWAYCWEEWKDICFDSAPTANNETVANISSKSSSADLYFRKVVLNEIGLEEGLGLPSWQLVLALFVSWAFVFVVLSNGVKSSGKAAYFLAIFPYVSIITLLIRAVTLEGAVDGIIFLFEPTWEKILDPSVWYAAVTQSFFSLGVCFGAVVMYSSYNRFDHNILRDCTVVTSMDLGTSLIAGTTIFGILGNLAHESDKDINNVVRAGTGLAFISYPEALAKFTVVPQLFAVLFFLMLFILGIGTSVAFTAVVDSVIKDRFPHIPDWKVAGGVCSAGFLVGIVYCTSGGQCILNLVDYFGGTFIIVFLASFELVAVSWVYGVDNFLDDAEFMLGNRPSFYWRFCWYFLTPLTLLSILIYFLCELKPITYNDEYYPTSAYVAGWLLLGLGVIQLPIWMFVSKFKNKDKSYLDMLKPNPDWGPKDPTKYKEWKEFKDSKRIARMSLDKKRSRIVTLLIGED